MHVCVPDKLFQNASMCSSFQFLHRCQEQMIGNKLEKGQTNEKKTRSLHKSETKVITRRRACALLALKMLPRSPAALNLTVCK